MIIILFLLLGTSIVYSARQPIVDNDNNQWGAILNEYLNVSHTESGALRKGLNVSFYDINITGKTNITSNVNMYNLTLTDKITFALGEIIDNLIDGWIKITGGLQVSGDITANSLNGSWNESGNLKTELRGSIDANITEVNSRVLNTSTSFGGEVSGSFNSIVLGNDALDDQYYDSEADLTGLLNDNYQPLGSYLGSSASGWSNTSTTTSTSLDVNVGSGDLFVNSTSGNVGIGTTSPTHKLNVVGSANITGQVYVNNLTIGGGSGTVMYYNGSHLIIT